MWIERHLHWHQALYRRLQSSKLGTQGHLEGMQFLGVLQQRFRIYNRLNMTSHPLSGNPTAGKEVGVPRKLRAALVVTLLAAAMSLGVAAPASAAVTEFTVTDDTPVNYPSWTIGTITWNNRTAYVSGDVFVGSDWDCGQAVFEAFAGSTKIEVQTRTACWTTYPEGYRHFGFNIGDPDLRGGINRIKITICNYPGRICGRSRHFYRP
jgi:hypothetical protein